MISEIFDELVVDVGDPGFEPDGDVLEQEVNGLLFFEDRLQLDELIGLEFFEYIGLFDEFVSFLHTDFVDFPHKHPGHFTSALLTLPKGVVVVHDYDYLAGHWLYLSLLYRFLILFIYIISLIGLFKSEHQSFL